MYNCMNILKLRFVLLVFHGVGLTVRQLVI